LKKFFQGFGCFPLLEQLLTALDASGNILPVCPF